MRKILLIGFIGLLSLKTIAATLPANVIAEHVTHVGFAPPEHRGIFKFQLLTSGVVQKTDNKNKTTIMAKLSSDVVEKITTAVNSIKSDELSKPQDPPCMDAPSQDIQVRLTNGKNMNIWQRAGCRDFLPSDSAAGQVADLVNHLNDAFSLVDYLLN